MGFDFAEEMARSVGDIVAEQKEEMVTGKTAQGWKSQPVRVKQVDGLLERPDGNNVSMDRESLNMAEAQLQFRAGEELLKSEFSSVLDAIHVDQKS